MKNYFSDEQLEDCLNKVAPNDLILSVPQLKALMNLAVETAIGEPLAWAIKQGNGKRVNSWTMDKEISEIHKSNGLTITQLYTVTEVSEK